MMRNNHILVKRLDQYENVQYRIFSNIDNISLEASSILPHS